MLEKRPINAMQRSAAQRNIDSFNVRYSASKYVRAYVRTNALSLRKGSSSSAIAYRSQSNQIRSEAKQSKLKKVLR
jgi:hypothetical protein